jgi:hypothetical protein
VFDYQCTFFVNGGRGGRGVHDLLLLHDSPHAPGRIRRLQGNLRGRAPRGPRAFRADHAAPLELGGGLPRDIRDFADRAGCPDAYLPDNPTAANILTVLLEAERCAIRTWSEVCDLTFGKDPRTYDMASRILNEEIEHEAWCIELLSRERDGKGIPSGHFRRGQPGDAPYSKNRGFYNP